MSLEAPRADAAEILRARARVLAQPLAAPNAATPHLEVIEFRLAHERYALEHTSITAVHPLKDLTPLPCVPPFVLGIVNVHGRILPVLDLKKFFDLPEQGVTDLHRIILVEGNGLELGLLADAVAGVRRIELASLQPALPTLTGIRSEYLKGVTAEHLVVLDVARLLADPRIVVHEELEGDDTETA